MNRFFSIIKIIGIVALLLMITLCLSMLFIGKTTAHIHFHDTYYIIDKKSILIYTALLIATVISIAGALQNKRKTVFIVSSLALLI